MPLTTLLINPRAKRFPYDNLPESLQLKIRELHIFYERITPLVIDMNVLELLRKWYDFAQEYYQAVSYFINYLTSDDLSIVNEVSRKGLDAFRDIFQKSTIPPTSKKTVLASLDALEESIEFASHFIKQGFPITMTPSEENNFLSRSTWLTCDIQLMAILSEQAGSEYGKAKLEVATYFMQNDLKRFESVLETLETVNDLETMRAISQAEEQIQQGKREVVRS